LLDALGQLAAPIQRNPKSRSRHQLGEVEKSLPKSFNQKKPKPKSPAIAFAMADESCISAVSGGVG